ncbi:MAG: hemolysin-type calcium-binding repeat family protein [Sphingomonas bacterium]|uniref:calcium-binding protein n=1 Tax=Sphingomonas bacterium TaxID=1895847 RepID=UPI0026360AFF|nr:calcium-binding protein [Sphingomonas bacterium]MDB5706725.1 hemolysin-type calcium-binding repeat family protein [Sphingomonas bacterium]
MSAQFVASDSFENRGDGDWFKVHLLAGHSYRLAISSGSQSVEAHIMMPDGQPLELPVSYTNQSVFVAPVDGDYFVAAHSFGAAASYSVTIDEFTDPVLASTATTASIQVGGTVAVHASDMLVTGDNDWYAADLVAGQSYVFSSSDITGKVYVMDAGGHLFANDSGQQVHFTATETGRYYLGLANLGSSDSTLTLLSQADDHADNIAQGSNGALAVGTPAQGNWESAGDTDWFAITLVAGSSYNFALTAVSTPNPYLQIADASGVIVTDSLQQDSRGSTIFTAATSGTYYVGASAHPVTSGSSANDYLSGWNYSLSATAVANDLAATALTTGTVAVGGQTQGVWNGAGDHDWLRVDLVQGQSYVFSLALAGGNTASFALYDAAGNQLSGIVNQAIFGGTVTVTHTAETTGSYYIDAGHNYAVTSQANVNYTVAVAGFADDYADNAATTGHLAVDGSVSGTLETANDVDWFSVDLVAGTSYLIGGAATAIYDAAGHQLTNPNIGDLTYSATETGTYYVAASTGVVGTYSATITAVFDDYRETTATTGLLRQLFSGTTGNDTLTGTDYADDMRGFAGADSLSGGGGFDLLDGSDGNDVLDGGAGNDTLTGGNDLDTLLGGDGNDMLSGGNGDDLLIGGLGADFINGGAGIDTVSYEDNQGAVFVNLTLHQGFGNSAAGDSYTAVENVRGSIFDDTMIGDGGANRLEGGDGNDVLRGAIGADALVGGNGLDTASYEDNQGSVFVNLLTGQGFNNAAQGDSFSSIENLTGSIFADYFIGSDGANTLDGGAGDDVLLGALGADTLIGGAGLDTASYEDNQGAVFVNLTLGQGFGNAAEGDTFNSIENLAGTVFYDTFIGDGNANRLDGARGNDTLTGAGGADTFVFDTILTFNNIDTITDFTHGTDHMELAHSIFTVLGVGALAVDAFVTGAAATTAAQHIIYNDNTGALSYDADGSGAGAAIQFATLQTHLTLSSTDFVVA